MIYYVYMLKSKGIKPVTYVGYTNDITKESLYIILVKEPNLQEEENGH